MGKDTGFTASANVRMTVEVMNLGPYGDDATAAQIHEQTASEAVDELRAVIAAGMKARPGSAVIRIVSEPDVTIVSQRRVRP